MLPRKGDHASMSRVITQEDIRAFAELGGDRNPVHVDESFAAKTRFGSPIAHGMWGATLISAVLGTQLPGPGTIYLGQTLAFRAPVYPGDTLTAIVTVKDVRKDKPIVTLETVCENQRGEKILEGEAVVLVEEVA
ncbi:MAG: MaoC family dehydratase [Thermodesulfobacteriota bacterium]